MSTNTEVKAVHGDIVVKLDSIDNMKSSVLINNSVTDFTAHLFYYTALLK